MKVRANRLIAMLACAPICCALSSAAALAAPSQQDVFKSISQNVGDAPDAGRVLVVLLVSSMVVASLVVLSQRHKRQVAPKPLNNSKKLVKEITRQIDISPREVKRLRGIAEQKGYSSPLVLMLCPSLLKEPKKTKSQGT